MEAYRYLWAKSGEPPHPLIGHMLDTAAVVLELVAREPRTTISRYAKGLGLDEDATARFLAAVAGSHDLGKATPVFQRQWEPGRIQVEAAGFTFPSPSTTVPHGALTAGLVEVWLRRHGMHRRACSAVSRALGAHHGFLASESEIAWVQDPNVVGGAEWEGAREALLDELFATLGAQLLPEWPELADEVIVGLMAITSVGDWIASSASHFPYGRDVKDVRVYLTEARRLAREALDDIGWLFRHPLAESPAKFHSVFSMTPNALQEVITGLVEAVAEPVLLVIETPMGTGKSEAAFFAHLGLQRAVGHRGMYVALPTMATGNGMFPRVRDFLKQFADRPLDLQLQHGTAILNREYRNLQPRRLGDTVGATDQDNSENDVVAREWFTPKKHAMLSEYGVGTVDQALLGVLRVRHHFVRLFGLGNRTVVLDEVHAYDTYTSSLIEALITWLASQGSSVILLSATLPSDRRLALIRAFGAGVPEQEVPYPRVTFALAGKAGHSVTVSVGSEKAIHLYSAHREVEALASKARGLVEATGCMACIVNTVERAQKIYGTMGLGERIHDQGLLVGKRLSDLEVYLFHARYPSDERRVREELVLRLFGKSGYTDGGRPRKALLIATQVAEQSLDLDFDVMLSDLAPIDLLLQRAGRLHRFDLASLGLEERPAAHSEARFFVSGLADNPPNLKGWDRVYSAYVLLRSWAVLGHRTRIMIPHDLEDLVERVYGQDPIPVPPHMAHLLEEAYEGHRRQIERQRAWALGSAVRDGRALVQSQERVGAMRLEDDEDQDSQVPLTRYGEPSVQVVPVHRVADELYLDSGRRQRVDLNRRPTDEEAERILLRSVRLSGGWIYSALSAITPPKAWERHALLRRLRPLTFEQGAAQVGQIRLRLDAELGVVYDPVEG